MDSAANELFRSIEECKDLNTVNIEKSEEFLINHRGNTLHVRTYWPQGEPEAVVLFLHGYASHISRPTHKHISKRLTESNFAYVTMDFFGHGHSDGVKGLINDEDDIVNDMLSLLFVLYSSSNTGDYHSLKRNAPRNCPLYVVGHSMGGANAILLSCLLHKPLDIAHHTDYSLENREEVSHLGTVYRGTILICPAIVVPKPPPFLVFLLENFLVPLFPETPIPQGLSSSHDSDIWACEAYVKYVHHDRFPDNPQGLTWGGSLRFNTAHNLIQMTDKVINSLESITYPFIVYHDVEDKITCYAGTERLMAESQTDPSEKTFVPMPGGLHDLTANRLGTLTEGMIEWIKARQAVPVSPPEVQHVHTSECGHGH